MNAIITRNIILDLLPAYLAGEVSADTRTLIENFMTADAEFAAQVKHPSHVLVAVESPRLLSEDLELDALRKTKRAIRRRAWLLALAIICTLTAVSYHFGPDGFAWTWRDAPAVSILLLLLGLCFWLLYFRGQRRLKATGM